MNILTRKFLMLSNSVKVWFILVAYLFVVKILLDTLLPNAFADPSQAELFGWPILGIFSLIGFLGVFLSQKTGFPDAWREEHSIWQNILLPNLVGVGFGMLMVSIDLFTGFTKLFAARHGVIQQYTSFPSMFFVFTAASIIVEVVYRLFLIPLVLWLVSNVLLRNRAQSLLFWFLAVLTSLFEPLGQFPDLQTLPSILMISLGAIYFTINLVQAGFFRKYGFLSAIMVRMGFYIVWHVLYIH